MASFNPEEIWPPQSAKEALLSSPSGRKRYTDYQAGKARSPTKRPQTAPTLLDRLKLARTNQDHHQDVGGEGEDEEEDEETLQLKLAAIEAKLKLKKLQQKAKKQDAVQSSQPASANSDARLERGRSSPRIEVGLSPTRRPEAIVERTSPRRILLGIDKGIRGADVSLRKAKTVGGRLSGEGGCPSIVEGRLSVKKPTHFPQRKEAAPSVAVKSFSERMVEARDRDRSEAERRGNASRARATRFKIDAADIDRFKVAAGESRPQRLHQPLTQPSQGPENMTNQALMQQNSLSDTEDVSDIDDDAIADVGNPSMFEGFSGLHLSSRILPHSFLKRTLPTDQYTIYRVPDLLKNITSPAYEIPDEVGNFVVFAIVASNSTPLNQKSQAEDRTKTSNEWSKKWEDGLQNTQKFMALTLTDLKWTVNLYLFGTALPRYYRLSPGTVIAVLNPTIMPPKKGKQDTGAFSLALHNGDDTVLEIGTSKDLGYCNVVKKDGKECRQWVDGTKTEICEWHLNAQIAKTQAKRMGVNAGANGFGGFGPQRRPQGRGGNRKNGLRRAHQARGFDAESGSHYFISSSKPTGSAAPIYNPDLSTAAMLDADDNDPFVAEGQLQRDKTALLQKRMAGQAKEREIARKLATFGSMTGFGAGADYMRRKADNDTSLQKSGRHTDSQLIRSRTSASPFVDGSTAETTVASFKEQMGRKRAAEDVRLSPAKRKKTRFLTENGIREAGRESIGAQRAVSPSPRVLYDHNEANDNNNGGDDDDDDDDDGLDII